MKFDKLEYPSTPDNGWRAIRISFDSDEDRKISFATSMKYALPKFVKDVQRNHLVTLFAATPLKESDRGNERVKFLFTDTADKAIAALTLFRTKKQQKNLSSVSGK